MQSAKVKNTEQGLTLLECLVGIMVLAVIVSAITPPLLIAYASRVQNYRTEQALQAAQAEINRVRLLIEAGKFGEDDIAKLPPKRAQTAQEFDLDNLVGAPAQQNGNCPQQNVTGSTPQTNWCGIDTNNDGNLDLALQSFRSST
ncbi:MAG: prepilin-type N-terminal cleavage/methylation domain-containing protein, partial [Cyanobacteriota bacterium]